MNALKSLRVQNYRCFLDHTIRFGDTTIVVGKNNAGKSTLIETLRLVSIALRRFESVAHVSPPVWLDNQPVGHGQHLDLNRLGVWSNTLFHRYGDPPAEFEAVFSDGAKLRVFIGPEGEGHSVFFAPNGRAIHSSHDKAGYRLPRLAILPQITPLERDEKVLVREYVFANLDSHLASRHFRNQLLLLRDEHFHNFREMIENSWPGIRVESLEVQIGAQGRILQLMIRDGDFVAEAGWMGHGLQMWLQTLWFVVRTQGIGTIVLDEPDVYMHPDLQRKLIRLLRRQGTNLVIATHSTEILAEVDANNVLVLDRELPQSSYAMDLPAVQKVVEGIGSAQNLQIARLWKARSLILVEGEDMKVLKRVYDLVDPQNAFPLDTIPNWSIGGWNGWHRAIGSVVALHNSVDQKIRAYCLFDSDYHLEEEKEERKQQAREHQIQLHILEMKEIENYLIRPNLIRRAIERAAPPSGRVPSELDVTRIIHHFVEGMLDATQDRYLTEFLNADRRAGPAAASQKARALMASKCANVRGVLGAVSGKELLSKLSEWSKAELGVSFGVSTLLRLMDRSDVDRELEQFVSAIAHNRALNAMMH